MEVRRLPPLLEVPPLFWVGTPGLLASYPHSQEFQPI